MPKFFRVPFGKEGDIEEIPDALQTNGAVSFQTGYGFDYERDPAADPAAKDIERGKTNWLLNSITETLRQYQTTGTYPYLTAAENNGTAYPYAKGAQCLYKGAIYESLVDNNTTLPTNTAKWRNKSDVAQDCLTSSLELKTNLPLIGGGKLKDGLTIGINSAAFRTSATAATVIYVRPTGNDGNSGTSVAAPKKTINGALKSLRDLDARGFAITINFDGTFTENISFNPNTAALGATTVALTGTSAETSKIIGYVQAYGHIRIDISSCRIEGYIVAYEHAQIRLGDGLDLHNPDPLTRLITAYRGGVTIVAAASIKFSGNARGLVQSHQNGFFGFTNLTCAVDFADTPTYSIATVEAYSGGVVYWPPTLKCTGTVIGKKIVVDYAGSVSSGSTDPRTVIPGTTDGTIGNSGLIGGSVIQQGWHMIGIPAMAFYPPAIATQPAPWTNYGNFRTWTFGPTTSDYYLFEIPLPPSWDGKAIKPRICWGVESNTTAGNAVLRAGFLYQPMGAVIAPGWTQVTTATVPCAVGTYYIVTTELPAWDALNVDPSKPGRLFGFAQRLGADVADTAPGTMYLRGMELFYQVNKGDDS